MSQELKRGLSAQESDVLLLVALGYRDSQIADYLKLSIPTVESHRVNLCRKLGILDARNLDALIAAALFPPARPEVELADVDRFEDSGLRDRLSSATPSQLKMLHDP